MASANKMTEKALSATENKYTPGTFDRGLKISTD